jgi:hypothetical protein
VSWLLLTSAFAADFSVELHEGITQKRDTVLEGAVVVELIRALPPEEDTYTFEVRVPEGWASAEPGRPGVAAAITANEPQVDELIRALAVEGLPRGSRIERAGQVAVVLHNGDFERPKPRARRDGSWELWEVMADEAQADTLSAAVAALQVSEELGLGASLVLYPCPNAALEEGGDGQAFGLLVQGAPPSEVTWAYPVDGALSLLPMHRNARPTEDLERSQLRTWSLDQLDASWDPGVDGGAGPEDEELPPPPKRQDDEESEDEGEPVTAQDFNYYLLSGGLVGVVFIVVIGQLRARKKLAERMRESRAARKRDKF